jgi:hypothetical protein
MLSKFITNEQALYLFQQKYPHLNAAVAVLGGWVFPPSGFFRFTLPVIRMPGSYFGTENTFAGQTIIILSTHDYYVV